MYPDLLAIELVHPPAGADPGVVAAGAVPQAATTRPLITSAKTLQDRKAMAQA